MLSRLSGSRLGVPMCLGQEKKLNSFHVRCLRRILQIKWQERVPDREVLEQANTCSLNALLAERRLRRLGHVRRMDTGRIPKYLFMESWSRVVGKQDALNCGSKTLAKGT